MKPGTKVVFVRPNVAHRMVGTRGTILEDGFGLFYLVEWDDGEVSGVAPDAIVPIQALKKALKHGPKIRKKDIAKA